MRSRSAVPKVQAVLVVKVLNVCSGLVSWAMRTWGCAGCKLWGVPFYAINC